MKKIIGIAASLLVNLSLVVAFEQSANDAVPVPNGQVFISYAAEPVAAIAEVSSLASDEQRALAL